MKNYLILIFVISFCYYLPYITGCSKPTVKVVQDKFITITNTETGVGLFQGHTLDSTIVYYHDKVCLHGFGDTVEILKDSIK